MTKEIAKKIRSELKKQMPGYKFSVRTENYSGGSSINVSIMKSPIRLIRNMSEIPENTNTNNYPRSQIEEMQSKLYHQLNHHIDDEYNPESWNNGVFLTEKGHNDIKKIVEICLEDHWYESDAMIDYFHTNFYFHLELGKWDKDLIDGMN
jgi:hypothetical protein